MLDGVRTAITRHRPLRRRMVEIGRDAADLLADGGLSVGERRAYRTAVEAVLLRLRADCATSGDLAVAFYVDRSELLAHAASAFAGAAAGGRVSPTVALDAAVFERARELAGLNP